MTNTFTTIGLALAVAMPVAAASAQASGKPAEASFEAPRNAVVMGEDIALTKWSTGLAKPSAEGQFEVLLRKDATTI
jgi:hypothetical protein